MHDDNLEMPGVSGCFGYTLPYRRQFDGCLLQAHERDSDAAFVPRPAGLRRKHAAPEVR